MDLTCQQVRAIQAWAEAAGYAREVRLFGSRAKGCARPDSDVDLAITAGFEHYVARANAWEAELSQTLGLIVHMKQYNSPSDECCVVLFFV
jgi:predicted nucleotidyltransferase